MPHDQGSEDRTEPATDVKSVGPSSDQPQRTPLQPSSSHPVMTSTEWTETLGEPIVPCLAAADGQVLRTPVPVGAAGWPTSQDN